MYKRTTTTGWITEEIEQMIIILDGYNEELFYTTKNTLKELTYDYPSYNSHDTPESVRYWRLEKHSNDKIKKPLLRYASGFLTNKQSALRLRDTFYNRAKFPLVVRVNSVYYRFDNRESLYNGIDKILCRNLKLTEEDIKNAPIPL